MTPDENFLLFLKKKKIDAEKFLSHEPELFFKWQEVFLSVGEVSFDQQKKFLFNKLRRQFPLSENKS